MDPLFDKWKLFFEQCKYGWNEFWMLGLEPGTVILQLVGQFLYRLFWSGYSIPLSIGLAFLSTAIWFGISFLVVRYASFKTTHKPDKNKSVIQSGNVVHGDMAGGDIIKK